MTLRNVALHHPIGPAEPTRHGFIALLLVAWPVASTSTFCCEQMAQFSREVGLLGLKAQKLTARGSVSRGGTEHRHSEAYRTVGSSAMLPVGLQFSGKGQLGLQA